MKLIRGCKRTNTFPPGLDLKQYNIMDTQYINIKEIDQNKGQIAGLPANPRQWTRDDVERLAKSIEETPELLEARPLIAMPHDGKYIVLGGNLRLAALKRLGRKEAPVYVLPEDTPIDKQKEIVVKDNGSFGEWDYDVLADPKKAKELAESGALVLREKKRPDSYFPVYEGDDFTAVLSSKDIRMVEHLKDMKDAGLDSLKIEGRMKSVYYVALVTRAYRKALDALDGKITAQEAQLFIDELENVSHRESGTGFYYNRSEADETVSGATDSRYILAAEIVKKLSMEEAAEVLKAAALHKENRRQELEKMHPNARAAREKDYALHPEKNPPVVEKKDGWSFYKITPLNMIHPGDKIEFISPDTVCTKPSSDSWLLINPENGTLRSWVCDGHECLLYTNEHVEDGALIRVPDPDYVEGFIRDSGR